MKHLLVCVLLSVRFCESARILGAVFSPSYSHQTAFWPIWRELSLRGHQLTVLTTDPMNDPTLTNLTEIDLHFSYDIMKSFNTDNLLTSDEKSKTNRISIYMDALNAVADRQLAHPDVQKLIHDDPRHDSFDLLMVEVMYPTQMAFAAKLKVPFIGLTSLEPPSRIHAAVGNPIHPALYPDYELPFSTHLTFVERLISLGFLSVMLGYGDYKLYPREDVTVKKYFGEDMPSLYDIQKNMSMLFVNVNPAFHNIRPLVPTTVRIGGGLHIKKEPEPLPADLKAFLDTSPFVYFSLGSNVKSSELKPAVKATILETLSELPYNVLWKFEDENIGRVPANIKILKWVPQQEVLAHPNIKVFIMQAGLQSIEEAILNKVPLVTLPFYGDQRNNAKQVEAKAFGLRLDPTALTKDEFKAAILQVATNPRYKNAAIEISELYSDASMTGLEKAVWWTEYVIRHKGAKHLRCSSADIPLYQYYCLDVIAFVLALLISTVYALKLLFGLFAKLIWKQKHKQD